jgi:hypothetical protein
LLARARELLAPGGTVLAEVEPPGVRTSRTRVRLEAPELVSDWFVWASVGVDGIEDIGAAVGFDTLETLELAGRWFAVLGRP